MKIKRSIILTCFIGIIILFFPLISRGAAVCQGNCVPDGCNKKCPAGCTSTQDPDCSCQPDGVCCGIGCDSLSDSDCLASACSDYSQCLTGSEPRYCNSLGILEENSGECGCRNGWVPGPNKTYCVACVEAWSCKAWSDCVGGNQTQSCTDAKTCGTAVNKPKTERLCDSTPPQVTACSPNGCNGNCPASCTNVQDPDCGLAPGACTPLLCSTSVSCSCVSSGCCVRQCKDPTTICLNDPVGINGTDNDGCGGTCANKGSNISGACALPIIMSPADDIQKFRVGENIIFKVKDSNTPTLVARQGVASYNMTIAFKDDGVAPDVAANDKIYTGQWTVLSVFPSAVLTEEPVSSGDYFINLDIYIGSAIKRKIKIFWPVITNPVDNNQTLLQNNSVVFKVKNAGNVTSNVSSDKLKVVTPDFSSSLFDDAGHDDGAANDRLYGGTTWIIPVATTVTRTLELTTSAGLSYDPKVLRDFTISASTVCGMFYGPDKNDNLLTDKSYEDRLNVIYIANKYGSAGMATFRTDTDAFKTKLLSYAPFSDPLQKAKINFWKVENTVDLECVSCGGTCIECDPKKLWAALTQCPFNSDILSDLAVSNSHVAQNYTVGVIHKDFPVAAGSSWVADCKYAINPAQCYKDCSNNITCHTYFVGWNNLTGLININQVTHDTKSPAPVIAVHEFGHNFGELMDEYDYNCGEYNPDGLTCATYTVNKNYVDDRRKKDWDHNGISTDGNCDYDSNCTYFKRLGITGCYPGCNFTNWYRSVKSSTMMLFNDGNFNKVSIDHMTYLLNTYYP